MRARSKTLTYDSQCHTGTLWSNIVPHARFLTFLAKKQNKFSKSRCCTGNLLALFSSWERPTGHTVMSPPSIAFTNGILLFFSWKRHTSYVVISLLMMQCLTKFKHPHRSFFPYLLYIFTSLYLPHNCSQTSPFDPS
jgi:hypothetical protein